jgi:hypothetical protein
LYGGLVIVLGMVGATLVTSLSNDGALRAIVYVLAAVAFIGGAMLTLRDLN